MEYMTQYTGNRTQDTGHRTQDTGHRKQDTGHRTQDTGLASMDVHVYVQLTLACECGATPWTRPAHPHKDSELESLKLLFGSTAKQNKTQSLFH